jgi:hypothetical protein
MLPLNIDPMPIPNQVINLISNLPPITTSVAEGQISPGAWGSSSFTIGTNPFVLTSITLRFAQITAATPPNNLFVRLYNDNSGNPGSEITSFTFTNPGSITTTTANNIFTLSTPQTLAANTTFWLVVGSGSGQYVWALTNSVNETGEPGWSIGNNSARFSPNEGGSWTPYPNNSFQFSVNGQSYSPVAGDPYFSNVVLFLKGNGENNSTNIIDSSSNPKSITVIGNTRISTDQSRFDNSSIVFNGGGDRLSVSNNDFAFGSGDFTIEAWVRPTGSGVAFGRVIQCGSFGSGGDWQLVRDASGGTTFGYWFDINGGSTRLISSETVNSNEWHFITIVRENSTVKMAINGAVVATGTSSQNLTRTTIAIGANEGGGESNPMFLDELRITKGIAREITLPTAPFPDL